MTPDERLHQLAWAKQLTKLMLAPNHKEHTTVRDINERIGYWISRREMVSRVPQFPGVPPVAFTWRCGCEALAFGYVAVQYVPCLEHGGVDESDWDDDQGP